MAIASLSVLKYYYNYIRKSTKKEGIPLLLNTVKYADINIAIDCIVVNTGILYPYGY